MRVQIYPGAFDEIIDFITSAPSPQAIMAFKPTATAIARIEFLLEKKRDSTLSETEKEELDRFLLIEHLMRVAKTRAHQRLAEA